MSSCELTSRPGERFVHQHQLGFLGQGTRDEHTLLLPAGKLVDLSFGEMGHPDRLQRVVDQFPITGLWVAEQPHLPDPTHHDHISHSDRKTPVDLAALGNISNADMPAWFMPKNVHPSLGKSRTPAMTLSRVLFPAPLGPTTARLSPTLSVKSTASSANPVS